MATRLSERDSRYVIDFRRVRYRWWLLTGATVIVFAAVVVDVQNRAPDRARSPRLVDLEAQIRDHAASLREDAAYTPPSGRERRAVSDALGRMGDTPGDPPAGLVDDLRSLGLDVEYATDSGTGRPYATVGGGPAANRGWGRYVIDLSRPARVVFQVPHPANDLGTEVIGVQLFREVPGAVLVIAGTHRRAANGAGDVAHRTDSMFHAIAEEHTRRHLPQLQLHGFGDAGLPSADLVLSAGAGDDGPLLDDIADRLDDDLRVCRAWRHDCGDLEGRRNKQGEVAARHGVEFLHVELSRSARDDAEVRAAVVRALGDALDRP